MLNRLNPRTKKVFDWQELSTPFESCIYIQDVKTSNNVQVTEFGLDRFKVTYYDNRKGIDADHEVFSDFELAVSFAEKKFLELIKK